MQKINPISSLVAYLCNKQITV